MKQLLLSILTSVVFLTSTQAQNVSIIGSVRSDDGKSLASAHVLDVNSRKAVAADEQGKFQLSVADSGTVLRISHIGFRPVLYTLSAQILAESNARIRNLTITLSQKSTLLTTVIVTAEGRTVIDSRRGVVLRDFSFADGNNLLLMAENGIRHLVLCDEHWQEVSRIQVGKKGDRLFEDCLGNVHLFGKDSVYQIQVADGSLHLIHATEQSYFVKQMADCSTSSDSHIFFSSYQNAGQEVYHYGFDRKTKKGTILEHVYDHKGLHDIEEYFSRISSNPYAYRARLYRAGSSFGYSGLERAMACNNSANSGSSNGGNGLRYTTFGNYSHSNRAMQTVNGGTPASQERSIGVWNYYSFADLYPFGASKAQYFRSVSNRGLEQQQAMLNTWNPSPRDRGWMGLLSQPTYSPMFNLRDSIFVFDHVVGICYVHDADGKKVRSFPIEHQERKGWRNVLVADANGQKLYAEVMKHNKVFLMEIDLDDGSIVGSAYLRNAAFVEHLKIKDGYAYYLKEYRDISTSDRMLKQRL